MVKPTTTSTTGERGDFSRDPCRSYTLPSRYYTDADIHRLELERIFHSDWCYVGHQSELANLGDYFVEHVAHQPVFVVRGEDGEIRAFFNVCQHRGHELLQGCGSLRAGITCPYHGWTYALDGQLKSARLTDKLVDFDPAHFSLRQLVVARWAGLIFVKLKTNANDFDDDMAGFETTILDHLPRMPEFAAAYRFEFDIAANWKVVVDNFSEGYHIPIAHRKLAQVLDTGVNASLIRPKFAHYKSSSRAGYEGYELEPGQAYLSWTVWPNVCMLSLPGCENLIVLRMAPNGVDRCRERVDVFAPKGETCANLEQVKTLFSEHFNREDIALVESVQRGLSSLAYDQSRYVADETEQWYSESGLHRFHGQVLDALSED